MADVPKREAHLPGPYVAGLITAKRDGGRLADADIRWLVAAYTRGAVPDEQVRTAHGHSLPGPRPG